MPRHTPIKGKLTRSFGPDENDDMVVELDESGHVTFRREPIGRRLKRNEKLPELTLNVEEVLTDLAGPPAKESDLVEILQGVADRIPIAKFEGKDVAYEAKVWLIKTMEQVIKDQK